MAGESTVETVGFPDPRNPMLAEGKVASRPRLLLLLDAEPDPSWACRRSDITILLMADHGVALYG